MTNRISLGSLGSDDTLIATALNFAITAHGTQVRKYTNEPYVMHPIAVAAKVAQEGGTSEQVAAALLYDILEDTPVTEEELREIFPEFVVTMVVELTDVYTHAAYPELNRAKRKKLEAARLAGISKEAKLIKRCDIEDNLTSILEYDPKFAKVYIPEKQAVLAALEGIGE